MWLTAAVFSAFFAGVTSILAKCGIKKTDSDLATAIRTGVVLVFALAASAIAGSLTAVTTLGGRNLVFLILSGLATGASWICYFKALSLGDVNKVVPIDKSSTVISILLAIIIFNETDNLAVKLTGSAMLGVGAILMVEKKSGKSETKSRAWLIYAIGSAVFAALTSVLGKIGISGVESNLGTAVRTAVVLIMSWLIVFAKGKQKGLKTLDKKELLFIVLSGVATGASWLCYYYAIQHGKLSVVIPIDKMSILITVGFAYIVFKEKLSKKATFGLILMAAGTLAMAIFS